MYISRYEPNDQGRNKVINYGQYQRQGPGNLSFYASSQKPPEDEIDLSKDNKKLADYLTKLTLKLFKIETNEKELKNDTKDIYAGLNYFI
jgi:hypothetical protein